MTPMLSYEDGPGAIAWLSAVFGFRERAGSRVVGPDGRLLHAELEFGGGRVMLATPTRDYQSPRRHRQQCAAASTWSATPLIIDGVLVEVDDVDTHYTHACAAGASILSELEDAEPGRRYRAEDLEGHRWMFVQRARAD